MSIPSATRVGTALLRRHQALPSLSRPLSTTTATSARPAADRRYVRIAGPSSYATRNDLEDFLRQHGVQPQTPTSVAPATHDLVQGQADVFQNQAVWIYDAGTPAAAADIAGRISGRIAGMKLIRAAAVDQRVVDEMTAVPDAGAKSRPSLRKRMNAIKPGPEERGRSLLVTNLPFTMPARFLWSFFASYEIIKIKHLRRGGVASVVFSTEEEAYRAMRERSNLPIQNSKTQVSLKMHE